MKFHYYSVASELVMKDSLKGDYRLSLVSIIEEKKFTSKNIVKEVSLPFQIYINHLFFMTTFNMSLKLTIAFLIDVDEETICHVSIM